MKISKKLLLKATKKLDGNEKSERKIIMWFIILATRYDSNSKAAIWNVSEKFMSVKIHVPKKASVVKLFNDVHTYFGRQREIDVFYLIAGNGILQY